MQWYNSKTNELQSDKPGATIVCPETWQSLYGDWTQVDDGFRPPDPLPISEQLNAPILAQITALEQKQLRPLREFALGDATALPRIQSIDSEISALRAQLK